MVRISNLLFLTVLLVVTESQNINEEDRDRLLTGIVNLQLQETILSLRREVYSNLHIIKEWYYKTALVTEKNTEMILQKTYGPFFDGNHNVLDPFFLRLQSFNSPFSVETVESLVETLMSQLFRAGFIALNPTLEISESQWNCMLSCQDQVQPFESLQQVIRTHLNRPLAALRNLTQALDKTHQLLGGLVNIQMPSDCLDLLGRLQEFGTTCSCSISMRDCLVDFEDLDMHGWNQIIDSLLLLYNSLVTLPTTLGHLPVQISEALMIFQEKGPTVTNWMLTTCFHEKKYSRSKRSVSSSRLPQNQRIEQIEDLDLEMIRERISSMRDWFSSLPRTLCQDHPSQRDDCPSRRKERDLSEEQFREKGTLDRFSLELSHFSLQLVEMTESTGLESIYFDDDYDENEDIFIMEPVPKSRPSSSGQLSLTLLGTILLVPFL